VTFRWRKNALAVAAGQGSLPSEADEEKDEEGEGAVEFGFIAQEVEEVFPDLVETRADTGLKMLKYQGFTPLLLEALKEQGAEQQRGAQALQQQLAALEARVRRLEAALLRAEGREAPAFSHVE
jgi:hypothetical protein